MITRRRELLVKNLKRLVRRVEQGITPYRIAEIYVFGSFLRFKEEPGDVDLVLLTRKDKEFDTEVEAFRKFIFSEQDKGEAGRRNIERLVRDAAFREAFVRENFPLVPLNYWIKYLRVPQSQRNMIFHDYHFDMNGITRRVLTQGLQRIQIPPSCVEPVEDRQKLFDGMTARRFLLLWSEADRDVEKHLKNIDKAKFESTTQEIENLALDAERFQAFYDVLFKVAKLMIQNFETGAQLLNKDEVTRLLKAEIEGLKVCTFVCKKPPFFLIFTKVVF